MRTEPVTKKFMNCIEFARYLGVSPATIKKMCQTGIIPHLRLLEKSIRIDPDKAIAALEANVGGKKR